jgi:hypothetical protein
MPSFEIIHSEEARNGDYQVLLQELMNLSKPLAIALSLAFFGVEEEYLDECTDDHLLENAAPIKVLLDQHLESYKIVVGEQIWEKVEGTSSSYVQEDDD